MKQTKQNLFTTESGRNYFWPFALVTLLFFLWGFAHSILDVLNSIFKTRCTLAKPSRAMCRLWVYGGYFLMALPAEPLYALGAIGPA